MKIKAVCEFEADNKPQWFFTKGHVEPAQFLRELSAKLEIKYTAADLKVWHSHARYIPVGSAMPGVTCIHFDREPGRGAFPITYVNLGYGPNDLLEAVREE